MAGYLPKSVEKFSKISGTKVALIVGMWHRDCVDKMVNRAVSELRNVGLKDDDIIVNYLPGSLELPYAANILFESKPELDAIIAFGIVLQGETTHDSTVIQTVVDGFLKVSMKHSKPIINEVIGVKCIEDAEARATDGLSNKGVEAVFALSELINWEKSLCKPAKKTGF